ncbi:hypothetical protein OGH69_03330 [Flavobacterium sp. MFBS3-15]|uniref:hypothetical protein n=1 Tax=Flavobacterium sp. MFBS3-15 TaxID=2989816 RepID=UPI002235FC96|nr:hypothetical protein [Flavobacterium sp. MFBS3-15]MCW4467986.1 hypothetical protein [Flavobacterium sp. MFBS3-15]
MLIKILFSLFVILINSLIYIKINRLFIKPVWVVTIILYGVLISLLNYFLELLPNRLIYFLIVFSAALIILNIMAVRQGVMRRSNLAVAEKIQAVKYFIVKKLFVAMVTIFQLLLIWSPTLFEKIITRPSNEKVISY